VTALVLALACSHRVQDSGGPWGASNSMPIEQTDHVHVEVLSAGGTHELDAVDVTGDGIADS
jgi:hypothetical protein